MKIEPNSVVRPIVVALLFLTVAFSSALAGYFYGKQENVNKQLIDANRKLAEIEFSVMEIESDVRAVKSKIDAY